MQEVSLKRSTIKNHISSSKHSKMKESLKDKRGKDEDIAKCNMMKNILVVSVYQKSKGFIGSRSCHHFSEQECPHQD